MQHGLSLYAWLRRHLAAAAAAELPALAVQRHGLILWLLLQHLERSVHNSCTALLQQLDTAGGTVPTACVCLCVDGLSASLLLCQAVISKAECRVHSAPASCNQLVTDALGQSYAQAGLKFGDGNCSRHCRSSKMAAKMHEMGLDKLLLPLC